MRQHGAISDDDRKREVMLASSCGDALKAVVSISLSLAAYSDLTFVDKPTRADADFGQQFVFAFDGASEEGGMGVGR